MLLSPNQLQPVQQSRKHVLRSYCSNMYTVTVCVHLSLIPCRKGLISLSLITVRSQEIIRLQIKNNPHGRVKMSLSSICREMVNLS